MQEILVIENMLPLGCLLVKYLGMQEILLCFLNMPSMRLRHSSHLCALNTSKASIEGSKGRANVSVIYLRRDVNRRLLIW